MRYIVIFLLSLLVFSCNENAERENTPYGKNDKINPLFELSDTAGYVDYTTSRLVTVSDEPVTIKTPKENRDTAVTVYRRLARTFTYYETSLDTFTLPYKGDVKPTDPEPGSYGTLIHQSGFDKASDINTNQGPLNSISTSIYKTGPGSLKTQAGTSVSNVSGGYRGEIQYPESLTPVEGVYEYDVYYENWKTFPGGGHSVQWHPNSSTGSASISLQNYNGVFNVVRSLSGANYHQQGTLLKVEPNRWYNMRWEIKFSTGSDGYIRLYIDNSLYYTYTGKTTTASQYFKLGQNRWNPGGVNSIVYYDNLKIWKR